MLPRWAISPDKAPAVGSSYQPSRDEKARGRKSWMLSRQRKLTHFRGRRVKLPPAAWHARITDRPAVRRGLSVSPVSVDICSRWLDKD